MTTRPQTAASARRVARGALPCLLLGALVAGCSSGRDQDGPAPGSAVAQGAADAQDPGPPALDGAEAPRGATGARGPKPLTFAATTLDGQPFDTAARGSFRRVVVYLVDVTAAGADVASRAAQRLHSRRHAHNVELVGVVVPPGYQPLAARRVPAKRPGRAELAAIARGHLGKLRATFPCIVDPDGAIAERYAKGWGRYRLDGLPVFYAFPVGSGQPTGRAIFGRYAARSAEPAAYLERRVLKQLGIETRADVDPLGSLFPPVPDVTLTDAKGKTHRLGDYRGRLVCLVIITRHCPRCKAELRFLTDMLAVYGKRARRREPWLEVLVVCVDAEGDTLKKFVAERGYTFPVAPDPGWRLRSAFRFRGATPDTFVIDPQGRIRYRHRGHMPDLNNVLHMEIATLLGEKTRPLLERQGFSGDRSCRICHAKEYADWSLTRHACAWETLVRLGRDDDPKCVGCHVVGSGRRGGFRSGRKTRHLANVQCESCHGANGCTAFGHQPRKPVAAAVCQRCHDPKHSPRFAVATHRRRVLHVQSAELAKLPPDERKARLASRCSTGDAPLFDPDTPYVGSAACAKCHPKAAAALEASPHALAIKLLATAAPSTWRVPAHKRRVAGIRKPDCIRCHVTGHGRPGGFPATIPDNPLAHPMAGVGCEACHGPGKTHADDPKKPNTILRLGGTCRECNILPICRQCHDDKNSPHFNPRTALPRARHPYGKARTP